jgi:hypothetical protein
MAYHVVLLGVARPLCQLPACQSARALSHHVNTSMRGRQFDGGPSGHMIMGLTPDTEKWIVAEAAGIVVG